MKPADHKKLESIAEDLFVTFPMFLRRVSRDEANLAARTHDPSRFLLGAIQKHGPVPMSSIGTRMGISKPYMTALVNKLIDEGYVRRFPDAQDRRVINVTITKAGKEALAEFMKTTKTIVVRNLSTLSPAEIAALRESVETMKTIALRLGPNQPMKCR